MAEARVVVLISGRGSNLKALIDDSRSADAGYRVVGVVTDRNDAVGIAVAEAAGVPVTVVPRQMFPSRAAFEAVLNDAVDGFGPDWIVLAGFMRVLSPEAVHRFEMRAFNIHPSLLPKYPGLDTHARALAAGDRVHGASVHLVIPALDQGPVLAQVEIPVCEGDSAGALAERLLSREHELLCACVRLLASGRVEIQPLQLSLDATNRHGPFLLNANNQLV